MRIPEQSSVIQHETKTMRTPRSMFLVKCILCVPRFEGGNKGEKSDEGDMQDVEGT